MKIDIEELERVARAEVEARSEAPRSLITTGVADAAWAYHRAARPPVVLALVARIRELEASLGDAAGAFEAASNARTRSEYADAMRALAGKGVVLP